MHPSPSPPPLVRYTRQFFFVWCLVLTTSVVLAQDSTQLWASSFSPPVLQSAGAALVTATNVPLVSAARLPASTPLADHRSAVVHKWFGYFSLLFGILMLAINKGGITHKIVGRAFIINLMLLNVSALMIRAHGFTPFHFMAIASLVIALIGIIPLTIKRTKRSMKLHIVYMYGSVVAAFTGGVTECLVRIPFFPYYGDLLHTVMFAVPTTVIVSVFANVLTVERKWKETYIDVSPDA
jgi:uncharacterized membrane protein